MPTQEYKFENGEEVKDKITDFVGIVTARTDNIIGCIQYTVEAKVTEPGGESRAYILDEARLVSLAPARTEIQKQSVGGPRRQVR